MARFWFKQKTLFGHSSKVKGTDPQHPLLKLERSSFYINARGGQGRQSRKRIGDAQDTFSTLKIEPKTFIH